MPASGGHAGPRNDLKISRVLSLPGETLRKNYGPHQKMALLRSIAPILLHRQA